MAAVGTRRWKASHGTVEVDASFEVLRSLPPHFLLRELQRRLMQDLSGSGKQHFQGLAQAAKAHPSFDNRIKAKLRLVDDATHLIEHITPESATCLLNQVAALSSGDRAEESTVACEASELSTADATEALPASLGGDSSLSSISACESAAYLEVEQDALECWWAEPLCKSAAMGSGKGKGMQICHVADDKAAVSQSGSALEGAMSPTDEAADEDCTGVAVAARPGGPGLELRGGADGGQADSGMRASDVDGIVAEQAIAKPAQGKDKLQPGRPRVRSLDAIRRDASAGVAISGEEVLLLGGCIIDTG